MEKKYLTLSSNQDGLLLDILLTIPDNEPKAIVQFAHGMSEYKERYLPLMEYLSNNGYVCIINDHRGHGKSVKNEHDLGYFYENGGSALVEDLHQITEMIKKKYEGLPLYLFGHSMGSMAVRVYTKKYANELSGLIVCGCPSKNPAAGVGKIFIDILSAVKGERYKSDLCEKMFMNAFNKRYESEGSSFAWLSADKDNVTSYEKNPLCGFGFTLNGYKALLYLMDETYNNKGWLMQNKNMPVKFISGENDPCMVSEAAFISAVNHMKKMGYENVSYKLYKGLRHEILNEKTNGEVFKDILTQLNEWNKL